MLVVAYNFFEDKNHFLPIGFLMSPTIQRTSAQPTFNFGNESSSSVETIPRSEYQQPSSRPQPRNATQQPTSTTLAPRGGTSPRPSTASSFPNEDMFKSITSAKKPNAGLIATNGVLGTIGVPLNAGTGAIVGLFKGIKYGAQAGNKIVPVLGAVVGGLEEFVE